MRSSVQQIGEVNARRTAAPVPWYTLDPRKVRWQKWVRTLLVAVLLISFSAAPVWRWGWYWPVYSAKCFLPTQDAHGRWCAAWHWVDGKEIRVYAAPGVSTKKTARVAAGVQDMVDEIGLDMRVVVRPLPAAIASAYTASVATKRTRGGVMPCVSFRRLEAQLIEMRTGDQHADVLIIDAPIAECPWALGMATFTSGVGVVRSGYATQTLSKHETGHLLGYLNHDNFPLYVLGYAGEGAPNRDTLMMLISTSSDLSPRAREALQYFWRGLAHRSGERFLKH